MHNNNIIVYKIILLHMCTLILAEYTGVCVCVYSASMIMFVKTFQRGSKVYICPTRYYLNNTGVVMPIGI